MADIALNGLQRTGRIRWAPVERMWIGDADEITRALSDEGFEQCKREIVRDDRHGDAIGGLWQGLNARTGAVSSAIWIRQGSAALVVVQIDGRRVEPDGAFLAA